MFYLCRFEFGITSVGTQCIFMYWLYIYVYMGVFDDTKFPATVVFLAVTTRWFIITGTLGFYCTACE